jgi:enoyl-CoA hydratase/carnithine racemase
MVAADPVQPAVSCERKEAVLTLTLNRPEKSNSLHPEMVAQLSEAIKNAEGDRGVTVVVITGAGRSFCAGLDLELLLTWDVEEKLGYLDRVTTLFRLVWAMPQPVIAAVNGAAIAGGFDLAAFCDIRLASTRAVFGQAEINIGLTQIIHPLYKSIGLGRAKELAMTGRNISADEAYRIGLVNHVYEPEELMPRALEMAELLASKPRSALFETKRLSRELIDMGTREALAEINSTFRRCLESAEHSERVAEVYASLKKQRSELRVQRSEIRDF